MVLLHLMVVNDLDLVSVPFLPHEADTPTIIDPNAVLPCTVAQELLESITRWYSQVLERTGCVKYEESPQCASLHLRGQPPGTLPDEDPLGVGVPEAANHPPYDSARG
jgi:hypothetical protein